MTLENGDSGNTKPEAYLDAMVWGGSQTPFPGLWVGFIRWETKYGP